MIQTIKEKIIINNVENCWPPKGSKIGVCMSGGVDSSTSAYILKKKGYEVVGLTGWLIKGSGRCCDDGMTDAAIVCEQLNISHVSKDLRVFFKQEVMDPFVSSYDSGSTPVPCITCNTIIKWGLLMEYAISTLGCTHIATGHYAKLIKDENVFKIVRPKDTRKDQTFMLWGLTQELLSKTVFPLSELIKEEVRNMALSAGLVVADKKESQDICFVSNNENAQSFLSKHLQVKEGCVIENKTGKVLGIHQGIHNFTIGQRKGLCISHSEPLYVTSLDIGNNIVYVGTKGELEGCELVAKDVNWVFSQNVIPSLTGNLDMDVIGRSLDSHLRGNDSKISVMAKVRYNAKTSPASIEILEDNRVKVVFDEPVMAITKGQACVFYDESNQVLLGGGWIT